ncbi:hypothetical protein [Streptomyces sp. TRM68367]|uniref:hypothetical protein n=1 Tax=Streptomyces sp. TRM68367 TaxID=2758415 RepID=UPI001998C4E4|nr:hypothetical protein [Streptomyces sp. TRM68367]MBC9728568.1 hypothetical protein [Streptomyces sp. TRM68367]
MMIKARTTAAVLALTGGVFAAGIGVASANDGHGHRGHGAHDRAPDCVIYNFGSDNEVNGCQRGIPVFVNNNNNNTPNNNNLPTSNNNNQATTSILQAVSEQLGIGGATSSAGGGGGGAGGGGAAGGGAAAADDGV